MCGPELLGSRAVWCRQWFRLLAQSLAAQQQEEEEAKEQAAVAELETQVAAAEDRLLVQLQREREEGTRGSRGRPGPHSPASSSSPCTGSLARKAVEEKRGKWKKEEKEKKAEEYSTWLFWEMTAFVLESCDRFSSCSPLFPYTAQCLVLSGTCYTSVYGVVFCVKRWITDPEVDLDSQVLWSDIISTAPCIWQPFLLRVGRRAHNVEFSGRPLPETFPYSALSGSTVDTYCVSLQRLLGHFTQVVRGGGLGPFGPFSLPVHTCLRR